MMFLLDGAFAIELIALTLGTGLFIWSLRNQGAGVTLGKTIGLIVIILSILGLMCTFTYGTKYWMNGYFEPSTGISIYPPNDMSQKVPISGKPMEDMETTPPKTERKNMYNMEHLQNMGSQETIEHMKHKGEERAIHH